MAGIKKITSFFSIIILPFVAIVAVPLLVLLFTYSKFSWHLSFPLILLPVIFGSLLVISGIYLLAITNNLFHVIGKGTLAPWNPPKLLVIIGPYKYLRNPMIGAVLLILLGEIIITGSVILFPGLLFSLLQMLFTLFIQRNRHWSRGLGMIIKNIKRQYQCLFQNSK